MDSTLRTAFAPLALLTVVLATSGCLQTTLKNPHETTTEAQTQAPASDSIPLPIVPGQGWESVEDLALDGSVSARMAFSDSGDLYYAYAQSLYSLDTPRDGLPNFHLRLLPHGSLTDFELSAPPLAAGTTTSAILSLNIDSAGNLYLLVSTYVGTTDTVSDFFYRYKPGATTPTAVTLPANFISSTRTGSGVFVDRANGKVYFAGIHIGPTTSVAAIAESSDGGMTWKISDASSVTGTQGYGVATDFAGKIYLAGSKPLGTASSWVLYRSLDAGASFTELDSAAPTSAADGAASRAEYVSVDGFGRIVVAGTDVIDPDQHGTAVVVRESSDQGTSFHESARFSALENAGTADHTPGFVQPRGLSLGANGISSIPVLEGKRPSAYLLLESPGLGTWTTALSITNLNDGEPYMQASDFDPTNGTLYLLTNYLKYTERTSSLRLTRFNP